jgi:hypothetical protein
MGRLRRTSMTTLRLALAGLLTALGLVVLAPAAPSYACSCAIAGPDQYVEYADTIFTGSLEDIEEAPPADDGTISSMDPTTYRFEVERVLEGDVPVSAEVTSPRFGASCGLEGMQAGATYIVFASTDRRGLEANLCGGTRAAGDRFVDRIADLTGTSTQPAPGDPGDPVAAVVAAILAFLGLAVS